MDPGIFFKSKDVTIFLDCVNINMNTFRLLYTSRCSILTHPLLALKPGSVIAKPLRITHKSQTKGILMNKWTKFQNFDSKLCHSENFACSCNRFPNMRLLWTFLPVGLDTKAHIYLNCFPLLYKDQYSRIMNISD